MFGIGTELKSSGETLTRVVLLQSTGQSHLFSERTFQQSISTNVITGMALFLGVVESYKKKQL